MPDINDTLDAIAEAMSEVDAETAQRIANKIARQQQAARGPVNLARLDQTGNK